MSRRGPDLRSARTGMSHRFLNTPIRPHGKGFHSELSPEIGLSQAYPQGVTVFRLDYRQLGSYGQLVTADHCRTANREVVG